VTRGQRRSLLASVELKLSECRQWLDSVEQTWADQPVTNDSTDYEHQLAQIQVTSCTKLITMTEFFVCRNSCTVCMP